MPLDELVPIPATEYLLKVSKQMSTVLMQLKTLESVSKNLCKDKSFAILIIWDHCLQMPCVSEELGTLRTLEFLLFKKNDFPQRPFSHLINILLPGKDHETQHRVLWKSGSQYQ